jgi:biotin carboxyl carrier protein
MKYQVKIGEQNFEVEVGDLQARPILATVEGETFEITPEEVQAAAPVASVSTSVPASAPAPVAAAPVVAVNSARAVVSPLPGTIIVVSVKPGDSVKHGQELMVLEAMKMKNAIRATREGVVAAVHVSVGDTVRHSQPLLEFKD